MSAVAVGSQVQGLIEWAARQARAERRRYVIRAIRFDGRPTNVYQALPVIMGLEHIR